MQGVFYRATAREKAERLGITGWARNTPEGDVEIMAAGNREALEQFTEWCRTGPAKAVVQDVEVLEVQDTPFPDFRVKHGI